MVGRLWALVPRWVDVAYGNPGSKKSLRGGKVWAAMVSWSNAVAVACCHMLWDTSTRPRTLDFVLGGHPDILRRGQLRCVLSRLSSLLAFAGWCLTPSTQGHRVCSPRCRLELSGVWGSLSRLLTCTAALPVAECRVPHSLVSKPHSEGIAPPVVPRAFLQGAVGELGLELGHLETVGPAERGESRRGGLGPEPPGPPSTPTTHVHQTGVRRVTLTVTAAGISCALPACWARSTQRHPARTTP